MGGGGSVQTDSLLLTWPILDIPSLSKSPISMRVFSSASDAKERGREREDKDKRTCLDKILSVLLFSFTPSGERGSLSLPSPSL